jgi:hypothetical protein
MARRPGRALSAAPSTVAHKEGGQREGAGRLRYPAQRPRPVRRWMGSPTPERPFGGVRPPDAGIVAPRDGSVKRRPDEARPNHRGGPACPVPAQHRIDRRTTRSTRRCGGSGTVAAWRGETKAPPGRTVAAPVGASTGRRHPPRSAKARQRPRRQTGVPLEWRPPVSGRRA